MVDCAEFIEKTHPVNVLDVMSSEVLMRLLDSYCFTLELALIVCYPKMLPANMHNLTWVESTDAQKRFFFPGCANYRVTNNVCDQECQECDKRITLKYYEGEWSRPKLYRCHLRLWDMTYELYVGGQLVGVLFSGQIIVFKEVSDWRQALDEIKDEVVWEPLDDDWNGSIPEKYNQIEDICEAIDRKNELEQDQKSNLKDTVRKAALEKNVGVDDLIERYKKFKEFGKALEDVLEDLYSAKREAARREHIHECSKNIAKAGDRLTEEPDEFWNRLDKVVEGTLPGVKGYVFYRLDQYREGFEPARTCIYDKQMISYHAPFRKFCKQLFNELREGGGEADFILYDLIGQQTSHKLRDLLRDAIVDWKKVSSGASVVAVPLIEAGGGVTGGLVCVTATSEKEVHAKRGDVSKNYLAFYASALRDIIDVFSMVLDRYGAEEAQAAAWAVRAHELVAPIHAVKGYYDNLKYIFQRYAEPIVGNQSMLKDLFQARLHRLGATCDLLELTATSGSLEGEVHFIKVKFAKEVLLPVVQPLREYGENEKGTSVYYSDEMFNISALYVFLDGLKRCLFNLVFNAIKYSNRNSKVNISLEKTQDNYEIHVINEGIGVPKDEEDLIFQRFRQGSNADTVAAYGAGLGLYVARRMARIHGGDVLLISREQKKTDFAVMLPMYLESRPPSEFCKEV